MRRFASEEACRDFLEQARWPQGPVCPACGAVGRASRISTRGHRLSCTACKTQFSVTAGTHMHKTRLPLTMWLEAMFLLACSSKGMSSMKLSEWLGIQYRTAWHLAHRIRAMMAENDPVLRGVVEIDEIYGGGPPRKRNTGDDDPEDPPPPTSRGPTGRGTKRPLVLVAAERGGKVVAKRIASHSKEAIDDGLTGLLDGEAAAVTDALLAYKHLGRERPHLTVTHSRREFARTDVETGLRVHVSTAEGFNSMFRRAVVGVYHYVSGKHVDRYAVESTFRWNRRDLGPLARLTSLVANGAGRVLPYRALIAEPAAA
jgi:transposase-like protein